MAAWLNQLFSVLGESFPLQFLAFMLMLDVLVLSQVFVLIIALRLWRATGKARKLAHIRRVTGWVERFMVEGQAPPNLAGALSLLPFTDQSLIYEDLAKGLKGAYHDRLVQAFAQSGAPQKVRQAADAPQWWLRLAAIRLLPVLGEDRREVLLPLLEDPHPLVRILAIAHAHLAPDPEVAAVLAANLPSAPSSQWLAYEEALVHMGEVATPAIAGLLHGGQSPGALLLAVGVAARVPAPALTAPLLALLQHPDGDIAAQACQALAAFPHPEVEKAMQGPLTHPQPVMKAAAAWVLGRWQTAASLPQLAAALADRAFDVRLHCAVAMARMGAEGRALLRGFLNHEDAYTREMAAMVLALPPHSLDWVKP